MAFAHSENRNGIKHDLATHLMGVARRAEAFCAKFGVSMLGYRTGLWHDVGKLHPDFQAYLANPDAARGPDHKGAGALLAQKHLEPLAFLIAGHHGGLEDGARLKNWLGEREGDPRTREALQAAKAQLPGLETDLALALPGWARSRGDVEFLLRMLFSALVDADFLDTERHFSSEVARLRGGGPSLDEAWARFEKNQARLPANGSRVNQVRSEVYKACVEAAHQPQGFYRLTVPTGGGKTRSSMAFALRHALQHQLDRVVVAIPYTSIIEQTAAVYREMLGCDVVLEHHSAVQRDEDPENPSAEELWRRLSSENWDVPVVVTTTVQLFESVFARQTSRCRKLHNIARSVLILDEVQMLPTRLLEPILDALRQLVAHYGVTVVLCTATQPALDDSPYLEGLPDVREIVPNPARLFAELRRVRYEWPQDGRKMSWQQVASEMRASDQGLAVVNTKADAIALLDALDDPQALHLSTLMCGAHRRDTLERVKKRLSSGASCRLVSAQVVEAGVDLDFPFVLRALGPLDRIVQAAGRCNREGGLPGLGRVLVFEPERGRLPTGSYRTGAHIAALRLLVPGFEFDNPQEYEKFFRLLYESVELDAESIQELRQGFNYAEVSRRFRMVEDDTLPVVVRPPGNRYREEVNDLLAELRRRELGKGRAIIRALQRYFINVRSRFLSACQRDGLVGEVIPGIWEWLGRYDSVRGLVAENQDPEELVI